VYRQEDLHIHPAFFRAQKLPTKYSTSPRSLLPLRTQTSRPGGEKWGGLVVEYAANSEYQ